MKKVWKTVLYGLFAIIILLVVITACQPILYMLSVRIADCYWQGRAIAWIDSNENGLLDSNELALENVPVHVDDLDNHRIDVGIRAITDQHGIARLSVFIAGCSSADLEVYADSPTGYKLTTAARIHVKKDFFRGLAPDSTYYFGFTRLK